MGADTLEFRNDRFWREQKKKLDNCEQLPNFIEKFRRLKNQFVRNFLAALQEFVLKKNLVRRLAEGREAHWPADGPTGSASNQRLSGLKIAKALR